MIIMIILSITFFYCLFLIIFHWMCVGLIKWHYNNKKNDNNNNDNNNYNNFNNYKKYN